MSGVVGLDYVAVGLLLDLYEYKDKKQVLEDLQVIEATVIKLLNKTEK
jgi:hypothetical protein